MVVQGVAEENHVLPFGLKPALQYIIDMILPESWVIG